MLVSALAGRDHVLNAYRVELAKALRRRFTYLGPLLICASILVLALVRPMEHDAHSDYSLSTRG